MKTYYCTFNGHYPVGACAVVVATSRVTAAKALEKTLELQGLKQTIDPKEMIYVEPNVQSVTIVLNGDY